MGDGNLGSKEGTRMGLNDYEPYSLPDSFRIYGRIAYQCKRFSFSL